MDLGGASRTHFDLHGHLESLGLKMACNSNSSGCRAKRCEICDSVTLLTHVWSVGHLSLCIVFKVIWDHLVQLSQNSLKFKNGNGLAVERNGS